MLSVMLRVSFYVHLNKIRLIKKVPVSKLRLMMGNDFASSSVFHFKFKCYIERAYNVLEVGQSEFYEKN